MGWSVTDGGATMGQLGSERGVILSDEEHEHGARITLELGGHNAPFAITCGIYGALLHTRFFATRHEAEAELRAMKDALSTILDTMVAAGPSPSAEERRAIGELIEAFVQRFP